MPKLKDGVGMRDQVSVRVMPAHREEDIVARIVSDVLSGVTDLKEVQFNIEEELQVVPVIEAMINDTSVEHPLVLEQALGAIKHLVFILSVAQAKLDREE